MLSLRIQGMLLGILTETWQPLSLCQAWLDYETDTVSWPRMHARVAGTSDGRSRQPAPSSLPPAFCSAVLSPTPFSIRQLLKHRSGCTFASPRTSPSLLQMAPPPVHSGRPGLPPAWPGDRRNGLPFGPLTVPGMSSHPAARSPRPLLRPPYFASRPHTLVPFLCKGPRQASPLPSRLPGSNCSFPCARWLLSLTLTW